MEAQKTFEHEHMIFNIELLNIMAEQRGAEQRIQKLEYGDSKGSKTNKRNRAEQSRAENQETIKWRLRKLTHK
jgi:hypothetical protein